MIGSMKLLLCQEVDPTPPLHSASFWIQTLPEKTTEGMALERLCACFFFFTSTSSWWITSISTVIWLCFYMDCMHWPKRQEYWILEVHKGWWVIGTIYRLFLSGNTNQLHPTRIFGPQLKIIGWESCAQISLHWVDVTKMNRQIGEERFAFQRFPCLESFFKCTIKSRVEQSIYMHFCLQRFAIRIFKIQNWDLWSESDLAAAINQCAQCSKKRQVQFAESNDRRT